MPRERLAGGYLYYDATTDDARLVLTLARTAAAHGAAVANRCRVVALTKDAAGRVDGATVDTGDGRIDVRARVVVNAAGVWADELRDARGRHRPRLDPPGQGHPPDGAVVEGAQRHRRRDPGPQGQAQPVRRAVGRPAGRHVRAHVRRHDRHRLRRPARRPAVHGRRHRLRPAGAQRRHHDRRHGRRRHRGRGPGCARSSSRPRAGAPPTSPGATASRRAPAA